MQQLHLFIGGYVQGVGYRAFVKREAERLELTGWVSNLPDGRVEVLAQGEKEQLEKLIILCQKGPFVAEVEGVSVMWEEAEKLFTTFEIVF